MKLIYNAFLIIIPLILIEIISQSVFILNEKSKYSIIFKPVSNQISKISTNYLINWDYSTNKMKPGVYTTDKGITYTINSKGFRGKEFDIKKNKIRVLAFGGSTTIGIESPDDKTYPSQLEEILNKFKDNYEVVNMGFGSKSLRFIKELLFTEAYKYQPDIIVIYSNRNAIMYNGSYSYSNQPSKQINLIKLRYFLQENIMTYRLMRKIYKRILNLNSDNLKSPHHEKGISEEYLINGYKNSILEIVNFSKNKNIKVILVKQPHIFFTRNILDEVNKFSVNELIEKYKKGFFLKKLNLDEIKNFWIVLGTIINKNLDYFNKFENVIIVDPINKLTSTNLNFTDNLHLTPVGNYVLASEIARSILLKN
jgi:lysophospholipase L1-like esterase